MLATGEDVRFPTTEGGRQSTGPLDRVVQGYIQRVLLRSNQDVVVSRAFTRVAHLLDPTSALFRPALLARVLMGRSSDRGQEPAST